MPLKSKDVIRLGMVKSRDGSALDESKYSNETSVDVTIRDVLKKNRKGEIVPATGAVLEPQESAYIVSEEIIHVPKGYVAYVFLKNRLSQKGLLAFNTGIVDEGYGKPISTLVTNLSNEATPIPLNDGNDRSFFRIMFHKVTEHDQTLDSLEYKALPSDLSLVYDDYLSYRTKDLQRLPSSFLDPDKIQEEVHKELVGKLASLSFTKMGVLLTFAAVILTFTSYGKYYLFDEYLENKGKDKSEKVEELKKRIERLEGILLSQGEMNVSSNVVVENKVPAQPYTEDTDSSVDIIPSEDPK